ncbi:1-aminocyclopropane-1-carboxylate deaminase/D-cysteine desulfhydrase [Tenacibaculum mesophilum]|uniref:1-aminocyclopropane-1-carboxylate deaminase/D-cysteine desulfhydrase n=1 Tax=Tenacibaculum mesophilum TaxID=104268 RepID=UPI001430ECBF|nr:pyridoxal-phosphate dependent enzyme [Tenacibaculum mesophilum]KAF9659842.1 1-aminocyclopropane-1-carboxylate deaminase/D-cysteine desulfhydrase [Tenacibaculum mesophilum]
MLFKLEIPIPENQQIHLPILTTKEVKLFIKREDTIHPFVSGNKFRKLKYNIAEAKQQKKETLLTFGGAFSNHIAATAAAGKMAGFKTIGIIRGDELGKDVAKTLLQNETLRKAYESGMQFKFITREAYRSKTSEEFINQLKKEFGNFYLIPEGGTNALAVKGCEEILTNEDEKFNYICCAVGTGGTISGLINSAKKNQKVIGFPALKGDFLAEEITPYVKESENWSLQTNYHFGGYGKYTEELIRFINEFKEQTGVLLDPVYTAKMLFGILDLVAKNMFPKNSKILAIHTGGLQGIAGVNKKLKNKNKELIKV